MDEAKASTVDKWECNRCIEFVKTKTAFNRKRKSGDSKEAGNSGKKSKKSKKSKAEEDTNEKSKKSKKKKKNKKEKKEKKDKDTLSSTELSIPMGTTEEMEIDDEATEDEDETMGTISIPIPQASAASGTTSSATLSQATTGESTMAMDTSTASNTTGETLCVCNVPAELADDGKLWIGCDQCEKWYHADCLKLPYLDETQFPETWKCHVCLGTTVESSVGPSQAASPSPSASNTTGATSTTATPSPGQPVKKKSSKKDSDYPNETKAERAARKEREKLERKERKAKEREARKKQKELEKKEKREKQLQEAKLRMEKQNALRAIQAKKLEEKAKLGNVPGTPLGGSLQGEPGRNMPVKPTPLSRDAKAKADMFSRKLDGLEQIGSFILRKGILGKEYSAEEVDEIPKLTWTAEQVGQWLERIGLPQLCTMFIRGEIAGTELYMLDEANLKELNLDEAEATLLMANLRKLPFRAEEIVNMIKHLYDLSKMQTYSPEGLAALDRSMERSLTNFRAETNKDTDLTEAQASSEVTNITNQIADLFSVKPEIVVEVEEEEAEAEGGDQEQEKEKNEQKEEKKEENDVVMEETPETSQTLPALETPVEGAQVETDTGAVADQTDQDMEQSEQAS